MRILCLVAVLAMIGNAACSLKVQGCLPRCGVEAPDGGKPEEQAPVGKLDEDEKQASLEKRAAVAEEKAEAAAKAVADLRDEKGEQDE